MAYKNVYQRLGLRMAEEFQLLAEQKWILEALAKIKKQRNCLQIERLHLESLKSKCKGKPNRNVPQSPRAQVPEATIESTSAVNLMQNTTGNGAKQTEVNEIRLDDETVNIEELDLDINNSAFNANRRRSKEIEEHEEEESDDDMLIDMNMFMNC